MPVRFDPKTKNWYYRFFRDKESHYKGGFRTKRQAEEAETRHFDGVLRGEILPEAKGQEMTLAEAGRWFLDNYALKRKRSWKNDRGRVQVIVDFMGHKRLSKITPIDVQALRDHIKAKGLTTHTVNHYQVQLKMVYNRLMKMGMYRGTNPADLVEMDRIPRARVRFLYPAEEKILTPAMREDARVWPYYFVGLMTGMRVQEICNILVEHVSLLMGTIFVPHSKTNRSRHVPISPECAAFLKERLQGKQQSDPVLGGFSSQLVSRVFQRICKRAGIYDLHFHDLRHTFAQRLLNKGVPIYKVSKLMGHSSVVVTEQHYGHLSMVDLQGAIQQIDGVVSGTEDTGKIQALQMPPKVFENERLSVDSVMPSFAVRLQ